MMESHDWNRKSANGWESEIAAEEAEALKALDDKLRSKSTGAPAQLIVSASASYPMGHNSQSTVTFQMSSSTCANVSETCIACENEDEVAGAADTSSQNCRECSSSSSSVSGSILDLSEYDMCDVKGLQEVTPLEESLTTAIEAQVRSVYNYVKQALLVDPRTPRFEKRLAYTIPRSHVEKSNPQYSNASQKDLGEPVEFQESHFADKDND